MSVWDNQYQNELYEKRDAKRSMIGNASNFNPEITFEKMTQADFQKQNEIVKRWSAKVRTALRSSARQFSYGKSVSFVDRGEQREQKLEKSIQARLRMDYGVVDRVSFNFERHGVFVHKGVGRGYRSVGGIVTRVAKSPAVKTRVPVEWFNPVLDKHTPELVHRIAALNADIVVNTALMYIK